MKFDENLANELRGGDNEALKKFFEAFYPQVCMFATKIIKQQDVAEDIAQEAFLKYWHSKENFYDIAAIKAFVYTTAKNLSLNFLKKKDNQHVDNFENNQVGIDYMELVLEEELFQILNDAIETLPHKTQEVMKRSLKGAKNPEISEELGVSVNTVKTLKRLAYKELRIKLKDHYYLLFILFQLLKG